MPTEPVTRSELATFYSSLRDHQGTYHNHKESLGWLAVAAYLAVDVQVLLSNQSGVWQAAGVFVATLVVLAYVRRQFNHRFYASQVHWAASRLAALAMAGAPEAHNLAPQPVRDESVGSGAKLRVRQAIYPDRLRAEGSNLDELPRSLINEMKTSLHGERQARAQALENGTYVVMAFACIATMLALLVR